MHTITIVRICMKKLSIPEPLALVWSAKLNNICFSSDLDFFVVVVVVGGKGVGVVCFFR